MEPRVERALRDLQEAVAGSEAVARARQARENVENREAARIMLRDLENLQGQILERARRGENVPEELAARYQQVAEFAAYNPYVRELLQAQAELAQMLDAIQRAVLEAAGLAPAAPDAAASSGEAEEAVPSGAAGQPGSDQTPPSPRVDAVRSRLWVPGQGTA